MNYRPMLGNNVEFELSQISYPTAVSLKRDGIRGNNLNNTLLSRELKPIPNKQVQQLASSIVDINEILDFEIYSHGLPFNEHSLFIMTHDINTKKHTDKIRRLLKNKQLVNNYYFYRNLPANMKFYIFDIVSNLGYCDRIDWLKSILPEHNSYEIVDYEICNNEDEVLEHSEKAYNMGYEGLVLRKPDGKYKFGRATRNEETFLKLKPIVELIGKCIGFTERMINTNVSHRNELGLSVKSNTVDNKESSGIAATVVCEYGNEQIKITLNGTEDYRRYIFENQSQFINKNVLFKGLLYGAKKLPRHPTFVKFLN